LLSNYSDQDQRFSRAFALLHEAIEQRAFPGAAIAVTYRGELVASQGFGRFTYDPSSPEARADTVFDLASVTKVIATTSMAMLLYERGVLDFAAPVGKLLHEFGDDGDRKAVTVRMLLAHSSGLPAYIKLFETAHNRDELLKAAYAKPLAHAPGTHAEYSDIGFILLGEILERLASTTLNAFTEREVTTPLGMSQTCFNPLPEAKDSIPPTEDDRAFRHRIIQGEVNDENATVIGGVAGHAGLFAPATDIATFAECMLRGGGPILQPATVALFTRREDSPPGTSRALGWDTPSPPSTSGSYFSPRSFGHLGFTGTSLWIDPERRLSVTILTNRIWPDRSNRAIRQVWPLVHDAIVEAL
jgi:CubicO group peptidase (beta-lactamase class C family)